MDKNQRIMFAIAVSCTVAGGLMAYVTSPPAARDSRSATASAQLPQNATAPTSEPTRRSRLPIIETLDDEPPAMEIRRSPARPFEPRPSYEEARISVEIKIAELPDQLPVASDPAQPRDLPKVDQTETSGFLADGNRIELPGIAGTGYPERYQVRDLRADTHLLLDFPGFCGVVAHAKSLEAETIWLPLQSLPEDERLHPFSRLVSDPAALRLLDEGRISLADPEGWQAQAWLVCSDQTVDGLPPLAAPGALTWMSGLALGPGVQLTKGGIDG